MRKNLCLAGAALCCLGAVADNPLVTHIFTADPTARVFDGTLYVYPSHDILEYGDKGNNTGFWMEDYHVFSTTDLMNYEDHGVALHEDDVTWGDANGTMWAPDCNYKNGTYYFYFPMNFKVGVATSSVPTGPFTPTDSSIPNANKIDPCLFIDDDGTPYLYYGGGTGDNLRVMRMKDDMITPDMNPLTLTGLGDAYKEGSFMFKKDGTYYFTYPYSPDGSEEIHYATGTDPLGPFTPQGTIIPRWTDGCWTDHHSVVEYDGQWYVFYHHHDLSGDQTLRSICAEKLYFNADGSIQQVVPTRRGIGIRKAGELIQVDRYLDGSAGLSTLLFPAGETRGFYLSDIADGSWINYPDVDFESNGFVSVAARVASTQTGSIEVRVGSVSGTLLGTISVTATGGTEAWNVLTEDLTTEGTGVTGVQDLYLVFNGTGPDLFNVDWVQFIRPNEAQIQFEGEGIGEVSVNGTDTVKSFYVSRTFSAPTTVALTATPHDGSVFKGWKLNGVDVAEITSLQAGDIAVAVFSEDYPILNGVGRLEAEAYTSQVGIQKVDGESGESQTAVGFIDNGDYLIFRNVDFGEGVDRLSALVAPDTSGGIINICLDDIDAAPVCSLDVPGTGGWTTWETVETSMSKISGTHDLFVKFEGGSGSLFNVDWLNFGRTTKGLDVIEAEDYTSQSGIQTESCSDEGGGENVGYVENGDYLLFENVSFVGAVTSLSARVSTGTSGGTLSVHLNDTNAAPVCSFNVTGTGWHDWNTLTESVSIPIGTYDVYFKFSGGSGYLFNVNWFQFEGITGYSTWLQEKGIDTLTGHYEDCDVDGIENVVEYALDMDPSQPSSPMDTMTIESGQVSLNHIAKPDADVRLFFSTNLNSWAQMISTTAPAGYPEGSVYYRVSDEQTGFFYWQVEVL